MREYQAGTVDALTSGPGDCLLIHKEVSPSGTACPLFQRYIKRCQDVTYDCKHG